MNKVVLKFKNGDVSEIKTKLFENDKIISFLKLTGEWSNDIIEMKLITNITSASCNYQNMDSE